MNFYDIINKYDNLLNNSKLHSVIQILNDESMVIENCRNIILFNENEIKLSLSKCDVVIVGLNLKMRNFSRTGVEISGKFHSIGFEECSERYRK